MNYFDQLISNIQEILTNPLFYGLSFLAILLIGIIRKIIDSGIISGLHRLQLRLSHTRKKPLTHDILKRRNALRAELNEKLSNADHIEVIFSDAIRGGYTYKRNTKFLGLFKRYRYQRIYITKVFDDIFYASTSSLHYIKYSFLKGKWVTTPKGGEDSHKGYFSGKLSLDNVVYIDWDTDDSPTLYYNPPLFRMFDEEFFLEFRNGEYMPYDNRSWDDVLHVYDLWANTFRIIRYQVLTTVINAFKKLLSPFKK